jgi:hypothetical protein
LSLSTRLTVASLRPACAAMLARVLTPSMKARPQPGCKVLRSFLQGLPISAN